jgi:glycosyltransferase involved in cell wall biosynthesis
VKSIRHPLVSIVLPTHNGSRYVRQAIDSCVAQTLPEWELIVVDDGSVDSTPAIVDACARLDSRVQVLRQPRNAGLPQSLNAGFARASGRYFTWISDDNEFRPDALETLAAVLDHKPAVDVVYSDYSVVNEDGVTVELRRADPIQRCVFVNCIGASFLYRREVHEAIGGFDAERHYVEDYDFWLRAAGRFKFQPVAQDLYLYRLHSDSLSSRHQRAILHAHRALLRERLPGMTWLDKTTRARACVHLARVTIGRGRPIAALADVWLGCRIDVGAVSADCVERARRGFHRRVAEALLR